MPNIKSAEKRLRSTPKRRLRNRIRKSRVKTFEAKLNALLAEKNREGAELALRQCFAELDKAAKVGTIHSNMADRKKSRLVKRFGKLAAQPA